MKARDRGGTDVKQALFKFLMQGELMAQRGRESDEA